MDYAASALDFLESQSSWRYHRDSAAASEPTAFVALALAAYGRSKAAVQARDWLVSAQAPDGQVGIRQDESSPGWPTPLAVLAWNLIDEAPSPARSGSTAITVTTRTVAGAIARGTSDISYQESTRRAVDWMLSIAGETSERQPYTGHDTTLLGWPWVVGTHSWVEPTAMSVLALRATGHGDHPRTREAVRLLVDRLLTTGGCNYGNTIVLGQTLLPHVEPTGVTLLALAGEPDSTGRIRQAVSYLESTLGPTTTPASLAYGLLGLAAHGRVPSQASVWMAACTAQSLRRGSSLELALLAMAALEGDCPLVSLSAVPEAV
jgi:hypothetical protein